MASRHLKTTMFLNFREELECPHFPKLPLLRCQNFLRIFLPFRSVGFCLRALGPSGRGSRGSTPLHWAARYGHVSAVARLIEAKAAVDVQAKNGRGLGTKDFGGENLLEAMGSLHEEVDEMLMVQGFSWFVFSPLMESVSQNMCTTILLCSLVVTIFHNCVLCPSWVVFFGPALGSDFAPEFGECPLQCGICLSAGLITWM